ncbi:MAG TPA: amidase family protein [Verrucomicrobiae bacterium]|nr:amidase family protein [Verrucomicrobiae bacterium]
MTESKLVSLSLTSLSASSIARFVKRKELSPVEVVEAHLSRIEKRNPEINAFSYIDYDGARAQARFAEKLASNGGELPPLLGVPITIKSCIDVAGLPCEAGSRLRAGYVAGQDATLVARLRKAGAILLGNTSTPEALMAYHTDNELQGRTNNPWDLTRTSGGSSGGEAAAIAACMSAGGIGSDGGGSIRVPAHFCGICGLKPTPGRVPGTGHYPAGYGPFSLIGVVGPMARTVEDLQLLFNVVAGYDYADPASSPVPLEAFPDHHKQTLTIGYYMDDGFSAPTVETRNAVEQAAHALEDAGHQIEPYLPDVLDRARELWSVLFVECSASLLRPMISGREQEISSNLREFLAIAAEYPPLTAERLLHTLLERDELRLRLLQRMETLPILLAPVCTSPAFRHEHVGWGPGHPADYFRTMTYSQHYNLLGNPAAVVPVGQSPEGLPIGVQVIGRPYREHEVLAVASQLQERFGSNPPPLGR